MCDALALQKKLHILMIILKKCVHHKQINFDAHLTTIKESTTREIKKSAQSDHTLRSVLGIFLFILIHYINLFVVECNCSARFYNS